VIAGGIVLLAFAETLAAVYYVATGRAREALELAIIVAAAIIIIMIIEGRRVGRRPKETGNIGVEIPLLMFVMVLIVAWSSEPEIGFIQLCAQVIPVLLLALAVQSRVFRVRRYHRAGQGMLSSILLVIMAAGEALALATVYSGQVRAPFAGFIPAALGAGLAAVAVNAIWGDTSRDT
jgi:hypothetical protein